MTTEFFSSQIAYYLTEKIMLREIYNAKPMCHTAYCCPMAVLDEERGLVTISDPAKSENGSFTMTKDEWNALVKNAKPID